MVKGDENPVSYPREHHELAGGESVAKARDRIPEGRLAEDESVEDALNNDCVASLVDCTLGGKEGVEVAVP